jgi:hypothetical protein
VILLAAGCLCYKAVRGTQYEQGKRGRLTRACLPEPAINSGNHRATVLRLAQLGKLQTLGRPGTAPAFFALLSGAVASRGDKPQF